METATLTISVLALLTSISSVAIIAIRRRREMTRDADRRKKLARLRESNEASRTALLGLRSSNHQLRAEQEGTSRSLRAAEERIKTVEDKVDSSVRHVDAYRAWTTAEMQKLVDRVRVVERDRTELERRLNQLAAGRGGLPGQTRLPRGVKPEMSLGAFLDDLT